MRCEILCKQQAVHNQVALSGTEPLLNHCFGPENTCTECRGHVACNSGLRSAFSAFTQKFPISGVKSPYGRKGVLLEQETMKCIRPEMFRMNRKKNRGGCVHSRPLGDLPVVTDLPKGIPAARAPTGTCTGHECEAPWYGKQQGSSLQGIQQTGALLTSSGAVQCSSRHKAPAGGCVCVSEILGGGNALVIACRSCIVQG